MAEKETRLTLNPQTRVEGLEDNQAEQDEEKRNVNDCTSLQRDSQSDKEGNQVSESFTKPNYEDYGKEVEKEEEEKEKRVMGLLCSMKERMKSLKEQCEK